MKRHAFSMVEVLLAALTIGVLGMVIYEMAIASTRGVSTDRLVEAQRHMCLDLLERFCQPTTDLPELYKGDTAKARVKTLSLDDAMKLVAIHPDEMPTLKAILTAGKVEGFTLAWTPRCDQGRGDIKSALRLDALFVTPVVSGDTPGQRVETFRLFAARGTAGEEP